MAKIMIAIGRKTILTGLLAMALVGITPALAAPLRMACTSSYLTTLIDVAAENKFFEKEKLDVTVLEMESADLALEELWAGRADIATVSDTSFVFAVAKHPDLRLFATVGTSENEVKVVGRRDRGITQPSDLRGKRIAVQQRTSSHYFLDQFLLKYGMTSIDVEKVYQPLSQIPGLLAEGSVVAASLREPYLSEAMMALGDQGVVFSEPGLYNKTFNMVASKTFINTEGGKIKQLLHALRRSERYVRNISREELSHLVAHHTGIPTIELQKELETAHLKLSMDQEMLLTLELIAQWAVRQGILDSKTIPNFFTHMAPESLSGVAPVAVTLYR